MSEQAPEPQEPMTVLMEGAANMHETFTAYVGAGFTLEQALYLVGQMLREMVRLGNSPDGGT